MLSKSKIKQIVCLNRKKNRDQDGLFLAEGHKTILEFLHTGYGFNCIVCSAGLVSHFENAKCEVIVASPEEMKKISLFSTPSQSIAICHKPAYDLSIHAGEDDIVVALDGIQDPGNMGTLIRLCSWFGIRNLICSPDTADCFNPKAVQASMGALAYVSVFYTDLAGFLQVKKEKNIPVYGTFLDGKNIYQQSLSKNGIIVLGNEGHGIRPETEAHITKKLYIPSFPANRPTVESLNVSLAASVIISEFRRHE